MNVHAAVEPFPDRVKDAVVDDLADGVFNLTIHLSVNFSLQIALLEHVVGVNEPDIIVGVPSDASIVVRVINIIQNSIVTTGLAVLPDVTTVIVGACAARIGERQTAIVSNNVTDEGPALLAAICHLVALSEGTLVTDVRLSLCRYRDCWNFHCGECIACTKTLVLTTVVHV